METKEVRFAQAWAACWSEMDRLGIPTSRMRQQTEQLGACAAAHRFDQLARLERWELSLEALALKPQWGPLFSDEEANEAIHRLLEAGCHFL